MTALTEYPAREEEFGTRAQVLPLLSCTLALGTQIVAALRLRFRLRKRDVVLRCARSECTLERLRKSVRHVQTTLSRSARRVRVRALKVRGGLGECKISRRTLTGELLSPSSLYPTKSP